MLKSLSFPAFLDTSSADLINEFFVPALSSSLLYDRGVGYFSSGWLRLAAKGMVEFAKNGGRARWVTSSILDELDWEALLAGDIARSNPELLRVLKRDIQSLTSSLDENTLSALAWMVADEILDFKIALPINKLNRGDFHDKFGIFTDEENYQVSFNGSYNDSIQGNRNYESIKVFCSWDPAFAPLVKADAIRFERLWNNADPNVQVYNLPQAAREHIIQLRNNSRPYPKPIWMKDRDSNAFYGVIRPAIPVEITLRDYQLDAIQSWFDHECRGLFEMATGTGKTITALAASIRLLESTKRLVLVIACPFQHLVDQWVEEVTRFGYLPMTAYRSKNSWLDDINKKVISFNHGDLKYLCIITTHATFSTDHFYATINRINGPILLIADEVHHLGSVKQRSYLTENALYRLALSATPSRWYDDEGTDALQNFFGETVYSLPLSDAIRKGFLTPYYYYPVLVELTDDEMVEYSTLSTKIGQIMSQKESQSKQEILERLLIKRAELLNTAENKLAEISNLVAEQKGMKYSLFYCAPGQIDEVVKLLGWEMKLRVHRFTAEEDIPTRQRLLSDFSEGKLQALVAMKCLDEGVDVPSTRTAYILASSSNPREFIQRRGRILRKSPGKEAAMIYDLIAIPPSVGISDEISINAEKSLLKRELRRFAEFADSALNTQVAYEVIWDLANKFGIYSY